MDIPGQWWTLFHSKPLNDLVEQALKANPDPESAQAALRFAWENVYAQRGALLPSISGGYSAMRQKVGDPLTSPVTSGKYIYNLHTAQVNVSYALDVFGGTRRQVESLRAQAEYQRFQVEAACLALTSNVVASAVQEVSLRGQIAKIGQILDIQTRSLELLRRQLALGQVATADVVAQEAAVAAEQAAAKSLDIAHRQLELGDIGYLALLNAEQTYQQASINLVQSLANRYADTAALFTALGGGWWNRADIPVGVGG